MSTFLVTGAVGFIASKVSEFLLKAGHVVYGIDNLSDYYSRRLKDWRRSQLERYPGFVFNQIDIEDPHSLQAIAQDIGSIDGVVHLAARAGVRSSVLDPASFLQTNLHGTLNILDFCRKFNIPKLILASSSSVYGTSNPIPFSEDCDSSRPVSPYAASKKAAEEICFTYHYLYNLDVSILRLFTVYGPAGRPDMSMFRFIRGIIEEQPLTLFGDGTQMRDFSFVDDIARGVVSALRPFGYRTFNLGGDHPIQINTVIGMIEERCDKKAIITKLDLEPCDVFATWANVSRAAAELSWKPATSLENGICRSIEWYLANREWASTI